MSCHFLAFCLVILASHRLSRRHRGCCSYLWPELTTLNSLALQACAKQVKGRTKLLIKHTALALWSPRTRSVNACVDSFGQRIGTQNQISYYSIFVFNLISIKKNFRLKSFLSGIIKGYKKSNILISIKKKIPCHIVI